MDRKVTTLSPKDDVRKAIHTLLKKHVTGAPVVDETGRLIGMFTERDVLQLFTTGVGAEAPEGVVGDFMHTEPTTVPPDMDVYFAAGIFMKHHFRRLPVVEDDRVIGAITRFDLLRVIDHYLR